MNQNKAVEKRALILDAAVEVFGEKGYHDTNIADIAQKLGMGHGTLYRYFTNKLDIFNHVVDRVVIQVGCAIMAETPQAAEDLPAYRAQVERIGERLTELCLAETHLARLLFVEAVGIDPALTARMDAAFDLFADTTEAYLHNGQKRGFLRPDLDTATTARAINAMIFEGVRWAARTQHAGPKANAWTRAIITLMFEGLGA